MYYDKGTIMVNAGLVTWHEDNQANTEHINDNTTIVISGRATCYAYDGNIEIEQYGGTVYAKPNVTVFHIGGTHVIIGTSPFDYREITDEEGLICGKVVNRGEEA